MKSNASAFLLLLICLLPLQAGAREFKYHGFSGGMMLHTGYQQSDDFQISSPDGNNIHTYQVKGIPKGIGGVIKFHFGSERHQMRLGTGGYTSSVRYGEGASYEATSFAFLELEYALCFKGVKPFAGLDGGGGSMKNHIIPQKENKDYFSDPEGAFRKMPYAGISPYVGAEVVISRKFSLLFKLDYLMNLSPSRPADFAKGPRLYVGFLFSHAD